MTRMGYTLRVVLIAFCLGQLAQIPNAVDADDGLSLFVNSSRVVGDLKHFWRSTGFCPPAPHQDAATYDLGPDMLQNLAYIGAIPHKGVEQVIIHWLLDLITVESIRMDKITYNFSNLDNLIGALYTNGMKPGFQIMGNPSNIFNDMENKTQVYMWKDLVQQTAQNYIEQYGLGFVLSWNWETWNEPDCNDFDAPLKMTNQGFLNYYDACSEGLKAASPKLVLGGPADGCDSFRELNHGTRSEALLDHVVHGRNYFTGEKGIRLDYLSLHRKGHGTASKILEEELNSLRVIKDRYPSLANKSFYNDEADPLVGWHKPLAWRADATYAALVVKVIGQHQNMLLSQHAPAINYSLLSNDNGFLSYYPHQFTQRTLLARFQMNNTKPPHVQFVRKPVHAAMGMLALQGETQVFANLTDSHGVPLKNNSNAGVIASVHEADSGTATDSWRFSIVLYNVEAPLNVGKKNKNVYETTAFSVYAYPPANSSDLMLAMYTVNQNVGNPYSTWLKYGKPDYPSIDVFHSMRSEEGPQRVSLLPVSAGKIQVPAMQIQSPDVRLLQICAKPVGIPDQVNTLNVYNITTGQILLTWSDACVHSKCLKTYEVVYSTDDPGKYVKINDFDTIVTAFVFSPKPKSEITGDDQVKGFYKVRAIDYWGRPGAYSLPLQYPQTQ